MRRIKRRIEVLRKHAVAAILVGVTTCPPHTLAATPAAKDPTSEAKKATVGLKPIDVTLTAEGLLQGQVVDAQGKPMAKATVALFGRDGKPVVAQTNDQGAFAYKGVASSVYGIQAGDAVRVCRVWKAKQAPPSAGKGVLLVADARAVRGQVAAPAALNNAVIGLKEFFSTPLGVAVGVGGLVGATVAIAEEDDPAS